MAACALLLGLGVWPFVPRTPEDALPFWCVAFSPDGRSVVTGGGEVGRLAGGFPGELVFWNLSTGRQWILRPHGSIRRVVWANNGSFIAVGTLSGTATLVHPATGKPFLNLSPPNESLNGLALSRDGKLIAGAGLDGVIELWDSAGKEQRTMRQPDEAFVDVTLSPDGQTLVATTRSGKAFLYDLTQTEAAPRMLPACDGNQNAECVAFAPGGRTFVTGAQATIRVWETDTGNRIWSSPANAVVNAVAYTPNGELIAALDAQGRLSLLNARTGDLLKTTLAHDSTAFGLAISPDGRQIATVARDDFALKIWKVPTLDMVKSFHRKKPPQ